jgi:hypothetical protein
MIAVLIENMTERMFKYSDSNELTPHKFKTYIEISKNNASIKIKTPEQRRLSTSRRRCVSGFRRDSETRHPRKTHRISDKNSFITLVNVAPV